MPRRKIKMYVPIHGALNVTLRKTRSDPSASGFCIGIYTVSSGRLGRILRVDATSLRNRSWELTRDHLGHTQHHEL